MFTKSRRKSSRRAAIPAENRKKTPRAPVFRAAPGVFRGSGGFCAVPLWFFGFTAGFYGSFMRFGGFLFTFGLFCPHRPALCAFRSGFRAPAGFFGFTAVLCNPEEFLGHFWGGLYPPTGALHFRAACAHRQELALSGAVCPHRPAFCAFRSGLHPRQELVLFGAVYSPDRSLRFSERFAHTGRSLRFPERFARLV